MCRSFDRKLLDIHRIVRRRGESEHSTQEAVQHSETRWIGWVLGLEVMPYPCKLMWPKQRGSSSQAS
jgi:hypothetical protein